ncbi:MAG: ribonuclease III [Bacteroidetes bacterium]|nr:ribonuclease III [Bacteroidota bacterium]
MFSWLFSRDRKFVSAIKNLTGFYPGNISVYKLAFHHRSAATQTITGTRLSNERLEYLGDAVLGAVVAELLFKKFPLREEGFLTEMRAKIVSREHLKQLALKLGINNLMIKNAGHDSYRSMYGDALEALIWAIYIDKGYKKTQRFILQRLISHHVDIEEMEVTENNFKSKILNWAQRNKRALVFESTEDEKNNKLFKVRLLVDNEEVAVGLDYVKKKAEQIAAEKACLLLEVNGN